MTETRFDALLLLSFGGPEGHDDVMPFLENVLRGKNVPRERMLEVAEHYYHFGGVSPINQQNRELIAALTAELQQHGPRLPIYWGNRNWHPFLPDTLRQMQADGVQNALALVTSSFSSYSGCRQYREDLARAQEQVGEVPRIHKLRGFYNHPRFIEAIIDRTRTAWQKIPAERHSHTLFLFTAHSIPLAMAKGCKYEEQLNEACRLVAQALSVPSWRLVYQSRSGPPTQPWLEPDICDCLRETHTTGTFRDVVVVPIGFVSDHMEVLYDLDSQAKDVCDQLGINMARAGTAGTHPAFVAMIRDLILERTDGAERKTVGIYGPLPDQCPPDCCPSGRPPMTRPLS